MLTWVWMGTQPKHISLSLFGGGVCVWGGGGGGGGVTNNILAVFFVCHT